VESMTIPFPLALIATKEQSDGVLRYWTNGTDVFFSVCVGNWTWTAKAVSGSYPNWKQIVPERKFLQYEVEFGSEHLEQLQVFLKRIPNDPPHTGMELSRTNDGMLKIASLKGVQTSIPASFSDNWKDHHLLVSRDILMRLVNEEHTHIECSECHGPFVATGGIGKYLAMPLYQPKPEPKAEPQTPTMTITNNEPDVESTDKETKTMIDTNTPVVSAPAQTAARNHEPAIEQLNPLDDLTESIEAFKTKLKAMFDESNTLSRKVKEVALNQKQKERDFILAKKAIERIRMASGF